MLDCAGCVDKCSHKDDLQLLKTAQCPLGMKLLSLLINHWEKFSYISNYMDFTVR